MSLRTNEVAPDYTAETTQCRSAFMNGDVGGDVIVASAVCNEEAGKISPGYKTVKPCLRTVSQPQ
ncbi:MAG: hypothetical protein ABSF23_12910 [Terracidiphilus sp.]|jgi:hypothetical protein